MGLGVQKRMSYACGGRPTSPLTPSEESVSMLRLFPDPAPLESDGGGVDPGVAWAAPDCSRSAKPTSPWRSLVLVAGLALCWANRRRLGRRLPTAVRRR